MNNDIFEIYRAEDNLALSELEGLGWCSTDAPRFGGPRTDGHLGFELGYLHRGAIEWWTEEGLDEAGPGSIIMDWPGDFQGGVNALVHPCERFWVRFNFPPDGHLPGLPQSTIATLEQGFSGMNTRHFPASPQMKNYFEQMITQQRHPGFLAEDVSRAAFHQILFLALQDYQRDQQITYSPPVRQALEFFDTHIADDFRMEDVAKKVSLSPGYFHELFAREVHLTPAHYHLHKRISAAKQELIHTDKSITALSMELGFSSSQYFATAFKKIVGIPPGEYRTLREAAVHIGPGNLKAERQIHPGSPQ